MDIINEYGWKEDGWKMDGRKMDKRQPREQADVRTSGLRQETGKSTRSYNMNPLHAWP